MESFLKHHIRLFFTALMFYTRVPCPSWVDHDEEYLNKATIYFPVIGWLVGGIAIGVFLISEFFFGLWPAAILSLIASVLITGAFHEDGWADVCDAFGGGWSKTQILTIMKDSRLGTYGVVGLFLILTLKLTLLLEMCALLPLPSLSMAYLAAHSLSRAGAVCIIYTTDYAREDADSKSKPVAKKLSISEFGLTLCFGLLPFLVFCWLQGQFSYLLTFLILAFFLFRARLYFLKWIEGYTGDCLGATQQLGEIIIYLSVVLFTKYAFF